MNKTVLWTIIIYTFILLVIGYFYYNSTQDYQQTIDIINNKYKEKYDSLNNDIYMYQNKIIELDSLINKNVIKIDSIKNKQKDYENPIFTSFNNLSTDSIIRLFSGYKPSN